MDMTHLISFPGTEHTSLAEVGCKGYSGFSLNPLTNDYDEAVINANWGLGESVVAGLVSPDHFIVDKVGRQVVDKKLGAQLGELTDVMCRIEELYEKPTDIEWAYAGGQLHVLQARPITTYVPLAPEMLTQPGERRRLYADAALSKGMTINEPISPMVLDWMEDLLSSFLEDFFGIDVTPEKGLVFIAGGRMYMNLSNMMWLASPKKMSKGSAPTDRLMVEILANIDEKRYRAATSPVKVLRDPYEKPVHKGDVLVAYTTDPGWTPLFVNAAAVVLEVGGVLQHGAVVAREYGKPCVVGIDQLMTKLHDGQRVEVDGTVGVIRLLS